MKKAQVTLFIIIAVILLFGALAIFYLNSQKAGKLENNIPVDAQPLNKYVSVCLESTAIKAIQLLGLQGGYINLPGLHLETNYSAIAYHYYKGNYTAPTKKQMEQELAFYVKNAILSCIGNFSTFKAQGFNISFGEVKSDSAIMDNDVLFNLDFDIVLAKDDKRIELNKFTVKSPIRLGHIYDIATAITSKTIQDPEWIDMTFLSGFDVKVDILPYDNESFVYLITDDKSLVDAEGYVFLFANSFKLNKPPVLNLPEVLYFTDGKAAMLKVNATDPENDSLEFSDDTAMFDITQDGVIMFIPEVPGNYNVTITVQDDHNNVVSKVVKFIIKET